MRRTHMIFSLLLSDERSAVQLKAAVPFSLVVLGTAAVGMVLLFLSEQIHRDYDRRVLTAAHETAGGPLV